MTETMTGANEKITVTVNPATAYINSNPDQSSLADLEFSFTNSSNNTVDLSQIGIQLPVDFYRRGTFSGIGTIPDPTKLWSFFPQDQSFKAIPITGNKVVLNPGASFMLSLKKIELPSAWGITPEISVVVITAEGSRILFKLPVNFREAVEVINSFTSQPPFVEPGQVSTLSWNTTGIAYCYLLPYSPDKLSSKFNVEVRPQRDQVYILEAHSEKGATILKAMTAVLVKYPQVSRLKPTEGPPKVNYGEYMEIEWVCNDFTKSVSMSCNDSDFDIPDPLPLAGKQKFGPFKKTVTFQITALGDTPDKSDSLPLTVFVNKPTCIFKTTPESDYWVNNPLQVEWDLRSVTKISVTPSLGPDGPSMQKPKGSLVLNPTENLKYTISYEGYFDNDRFTPENRLPGKMKTIDSVLEIKPRQVKINSFAASPELINVGNKTVYDSNELRLKWDTTAEVISIDNGIGSVSMKDEKLISQPPDNRTYVLTAGTRTIPDMMRQEVNVKNTYGPFHVSLWSQTKLPDTSYYKAVYIFMVTRIPTFDDLSWVKKLPSDKGNFYIRAMLNGLATTDGKTEPVELSGILYPDKNDPSPVHLVFMAFTKEKRVPFTDDIDWKNLPVLTITKGIDKKDVDPPATTVEALLKDANIDVGQLIKDHGNK